MENCIMYLYHSQITISCSNGLKQVPSLKKYSIIAFSPHSEIYFQGLPNILESVGGDHKKTTHNTVQDTNKTKITKRINCDRCDKKFNKKEILN